MTCYSPILDFKVERMVWFARKEGWASCLKLQTCVISKAMSFLKVGHIDINMIHMTSIHVSIRSKQATAWVNDIQTWFLYDFVKCDRFLSYFMAATCSHKSMMSDFKIGFRNLVLRSVACMFSGQLRTVGSEILPTRRLLGFGHFERIWSSTKIKQTQMMLCRHHHKSMGWLLWIPWARHFMIQLRFPKALALLKVSRCFFLLGTYPCRSSQPAVPI